MRLDEHPLLWYVIERCRRVSSVDDVVVLTSTEPADDAIELYCRENNIEFFRGSELDVFARFADAAERYAADVIVRVTGDNPFVDVGVIEDAIALRLRTGADLVSTRDMDGKKITRRFLPAGLSVDVFAAAPLRNADRDTLDAFEREHVIPYFFNRRDSLKIEFLTRDLDPASLEFHLSVDTQEDLERARRVLARLDWNDFDWSDVVAAARAIGAG